MTLDSPTGGAKGGLLGSGSPIDDMALMQRLVHFASFVVEGDQAMAAADMMATSGEKDQQQPVVGSPFASSTISSSPGGGGAASEIELRAHSSSKRVRRRSSSVRHGNRMSCL